MTATTGNVEKNKPEPSTLYLVATPIGNAADLSPRAQKILSECDFVAAEDTRNTRKLLGLYGIKKELVSYHDHNRAARGGSICDRLEAGECCALVTDAGMPAVSDPGEDLVRLCAARGISVRVVPGPCAAVSALALSAISTSRFFFEGFLPVGNTERAARLQQIKRQEATMILYEAPHKLAHTLRDLARTLGEDRRIALCREMTKLNEETLRLSLGEACAYFEQREPRGEFVLVLEGAADYRTRTRAPEREEEAFLALSPSAHVALYEKEGLPHGDAVKAAAADRGLSKSDFYRLLVQEKEGS
ncbi:MAG: 16S rRNA (cytidine(1402)-2'-O)-methyltransferase [Clostridia bacterium]|nr:16S rRNA (cytidine(1402)-2'-O)-methyltransferase [Clostridia bacterium]